MPNKGEAQSSDPSTSMSPAEGGATALPRRTDVLTGLQVRPDRALEWRRLSHLEGEYELRQGSTVLGEMERGYGTDVAASGECLGTSLEFRLWRRPFASIRVETTLALLAGPGSRLEGPSFEGLTPGWGRVTTPVGEELRWRPVLAGLNQQRLTDETGRVLLRLRPPWFSLTSRRAVVIVRPEGWERPDLPQLLLMTWFLRLLTLAGGRRAIRRRRNPDR